METDDGHQSIAERLKDESSRSRRGPSALVPLLHRLGLRTARDVLFFFPRGYEDLTRICAIGEIDGSGPVSVCGVVEEVESRALAEGRSMLGVADPRRLGTLRAVWFNQPFMQQRLARWTAHDVSRACPSGAGWAGKSRIRVS